MRRRALARCTLIAALLVGATAHAQSASLQHREIYAGDVATLIVEYRSPILSLFELNTDSLDQNFQVLDIKPSVHRDPDPDSNMSIVRWKIALLPRDTGQLSIAPIPIREYFTPELAITVLPREATGDERVTVASRAQPLQAWAGQQITVSTEVRHNRPMPGSRLSEPETAVADRFVRGQTTHTRSGAEVEVRERRIAIFIDKPGTVTIPAATLRAEIDNLDGDGQLVSDRPLRSIYRRGEPLSITVLAPPPDQAEHWLPAHSIEIDHQWQLPDRALRVGDSFATTLVITATGAMAQSLPADILARNNGQFSVYADAAERQTRFDGEQVIAQLSQRYLIVLNSDGDIAIPDTRLGWWDTRQNRAIVETIEGRTLSVLPVLAPGVPGAERQRAGLTAAVAVALAILAGLIGVRYSLRRTSFRRRKLAAACRTGNRELARDQLLHWARQHCGEPVHGLAGAARLASPPLQADILTLQRALYGGQPHWSGGALWQNFCRQPRRARTRKSRDALPDLYPDSG